MKTIEQTYKIEADVHDVWEALTNPEIIDLWGGGPSRMRPEVDYVFEFWGGDIHGKNLEVVSEERLVQEWEAGDWEKPSRVEFALEDDAGSTTVHLTHTGVPDEEYDDIKQGWKEYYMGPLKEYLEANA